ncbi:MAG: cytochrome, partial [Waterburya sp.]
MAMTIIGVMGVGNLATPKDLELAFQLGQLIAENGWILLTGGREAGVMDAASRGAKAGGGLVIGILPSHDTA